MGNRQSQTEGSSSPSVTQMTSSAVATPSGGGGSGGSGSGGRAAGAGPSRVDRHRARSMGYFLDAPSSAAAPATGATSTFDAPANIAALRQALDDLRQLGLVGTSSSDDDSPPTPVGASADPLAVPHSATRARRRAPPRARHSASAPRHLSLPHSLPASLFRVGDLKCPVCAKLVPYDDVELHLVMCLTKPRVTYNDELLVADHGECVICLEELAVGQTVARLPCFCLFHKHCIDTWFKVDQMCPLHRGS